MILIKRKSRNGASYWAAVGEEISAPPCNPPETSKNAAITSIPQPDALESELIFHRHLAEE
jgi:hypothetical protein